VRTPLWGVGSVIALCAALTQDGAATAAKRRAEIMLAMARDMSEIAKRVRATGDFAAVEERAINIRQAGETLPQLSPAGARSAGFQAMAGNLVQAAGALERAAAAADPTAMSIQYRAVWQACGACHEVFRRRK